jgi:hypothetical protein
MHLFIGRWRNGGNKQYCFNYKKIVRQKQLEITMRNLSPSLLKQKITFYISFN